MNQNAVPSIPARMVRLAEKPVTHTNVFVEMDLEDIIAKVMDNKYRILHGCEKIWILCSSGKNNISRVSAANE